MPAVTIRKLSTQVHQALRRRAAENGRSTEAEMRSILEAAVPLADPVKLGTALAAIGRELNAVELDVSRDKSPARFVAFD